MSKETLLKTVDKAVRDTRFRSQLLKDPKNALSGLSLSREEYGAIVQLTNDSFEYFQKNLETKAIITNTACMVVTACTGREYETTLSRYNLTDLVKLVDG